MSFGEGDLHETVLDLNIRLASLDAEAKGLSTLLGIERERNDELSGKLERERMNVDALQLQVKKLREGSAEPAEKFNACRFLSVNPRDIERAGDIVDEVCRNHDIDPDEVWDSIKFDFDMEFGTRFGNHVIDILFFNLKERLVRDGLHKTDDIEWHAEGPCSNFYIDGEEQ